MGLQVANLHYFRPGCLDRAMLFCKVLEISVYILYIYTRIHTRLKEQQRDPRSVWEDALLSVPSCAVSWVISVSHRTDTQVMLLWLDPSCPTELQVALSTSTFWKSWFTVMKHCLILTFFFFFNKNTLTKVTQDFTEMAAMDRIWTDF